MTHSAVLELPALILNRNWTPIQTSTVRDAIGLVAKGSALIIDPLTYQTHDLHSWADVARIRLERAGPESGAPGDLGPVPGPPLDLPLDPPHDPPLDLSLAPPVDPPGE